MLCEHPAPLRSQHLPELRRRGCRPCCRRRLDGVVRSASLVTPGRSCEVVRRGEGRGEREKKGNSFPCYATGRILIDGGAKRLLHSTPAVSQPLRRPSHIRALPCEPPTTDRWGTLIPVRYFAPSGHVISLDGTDRGKPRDRGVGEGVVRSGGQWCPKGSFIENLDFSSAGIG